MYPSISIVVPTYNEEDNIERCLDSIYFQDYPKELLEVIVVDNYSEDKTLELIKRYPVTVLMNRKKDAQVSKMIGFRKATGDLFYYMDADLEFVNKDYLKKLLKPLLEDPQIVGSSGKIIQAPQDTSLNKFLTYDIHQRDPVLEYFSPSILSTVSEKRDGYLLCEYTPEIIPPVGRCLFWRKKLMQTPIWKEEKFMELDNLVILVKNGFTRFAFVPEAIEYHLHVKGIKSLINKRLRNIDRNFLPSYKTRRYTWFNLGNKRDVFKILFWIMYAHLIIPAAVKGFIKAVHFRDFRCILYEPLLTLLLTDITLYGFITDPRGLAFIRSKLLR